MFDKDTGEALGITCNTEFDVLQLSEAAQSFVLMSKSLAMEIQRKISR